MSVAAIVWQLGVPAEPMIGPRMMAGVALGGAGLFWWEARSAHPGEVRVAILTWTWSVSLALSGLAIALGQTVHVGRWVPLVLGCGIAIQAGYPWLVVPESASTEPQAH